MEIHLVLCSMCDLLVVTLITELVRKEVEALFKARDENVEQLTQQVKTIIKDVERITQELESQNASWKNRNSQGPTSSFSSPTKLQGSPKKYVKTHTQIVT
jgi:hypothetical protein